MLEALLASRYDKTQREIAYHLWITEYKHESYDYILMMVRNGKAHELGVPTVK